MKAAFCYSPKKFLIDEIPKPTIDEDEILVKIIACGICGSDIKKIFDDKVKKPIVLGHEVTGDVVEIGSGVKDFKVGDRVVVTHHVPCFNCQYCKHENYSMCKQFKSTNIYPGGFSQYIRVPKENVSVGTLKIDEKVSYEEASFSEPLACCLYSLGKINLFQKDFVVIIGLGTIGLLFYQLIRNKKAIPIGIDIDENRVDFAKKFGFDFALNPNKENVTEEILNITKGIGADLVILTVVNEKILNQSLSYIRDGGKIIIFAGAINKEIVKININELYRREISIIGSYSSSPKYLSQALELISDKDINVKNLITHRLPLEEIEKAVELIVSRKAYKVIIEPWK
ncbi:MAG: alcohol dehydrogenase catalytic domain-containing protein [Candidatus Humimicrobiia bacterium]